MKTLQTLIVSGSILMGLTACSTTNDTTQASQETILIEGVAATGYAMVDAEIKIRSASGDEIYTGQTNAQGEYSASLAKDTSLYPLQIQVQQGENLFRHILVLSGAEDSAIVAHLNPITEMVSQQIQQQVQDLKQVKKEFCDSLGQAKVEALLGAGVQYAAFSQNKAYVAAVKGDTTIQPSAEDMVLHALGEMARISGENLQSFIETQAQQQKKLLMEDESFQAQWTIQMQNFGMDSASIYDGIQKMVEGVPTESLEQKMESMKQVDVELPAGCTATEALVLQQELLVLQFQWQSNPSDLTMETAIQEKTQEMDRICNENEVITSSSSQGSDAEPIGGDSSSSATDASSSSGAVECKNIQGI